MSVTTSWARCAQSFGLGQSSIVFPQPNSSSFPLEKQIATLVDSKKKLGQFLSRAHPRGSFFGKMSFLQNDSDYKALCRLAGNDSLQKLIRWQKNKKQTNKGRL